MCDSFQGIKKKTKLYIHISSSNVLYDEKTLRLRKACNILFDNLFCKFVFYIKHHHSLHKSIERFYVQTYYVYPILPHKYYQHNRQQFSAAVCLYRYYYKRKKENSYNISTFLSLYIYYIKHQCGNFFIPYYFKFLQNKEVIENICFIFLFLFIPSESGRDNILQADVKMYAMSSYIQTNSVHHICVTDFLI